MILYKQRYSQNVKALADTLKNIITENKSNNDNAKVEKELRTEKMNEEKGEKNINSKPIERKVDKDTVEFISCLPSVINSLCTNDIFIAANMKEVRI